MWGQSEHCVRFWMISKSKLFGDVMKEKTILLNKYSNRSVRLFEIMNVDVRVLEIND